MGKKLLAVVIFLVLIVGVAYFLYKASVKPAKAPAAEQQAAAPSQAPASNMGATQPTSSQSSTAAKPAAPSITVGNQQLQGTFSSGEASADGGTIQVVEVDFDGSKFSPTSVSINLDDYVFFKNKSQTNMWPISNPASAYPNFDAKQSIAPGKEFKFQFNQAGTWNYADNLGSGAGGVVNVSK